MSEEPTTNSLNRVAIIGCGHVGATSADALVMSGTEREGLRASAAILERSLAGLRGKRSITA